MDIEKRNFKVELRKADDDDSTKLTGYAAVFNSYSDDLGGFREKIKPGAFKKALKISDVRALYNHDTNQLPLGRTPETLTLKEDKKGLFVEIDLPDTNLARDLQVSIERGDISQMSFGFTVGEDGQEWNEKEGETTRTITEMNELFDVSPVVYPAYKKTEIEVNAALDSLKEWRTNNKSDGETPTEQDENGETPDLSSLKRRQLENELNRKKMIL